MAGAADEVTGTALDAVGCDLLPEISFEGGFDRCAKIGSRVQTVRLAVLDEFVVASGPLLLKALEQFFGRGN